MLLVGSSRFSGSDGLTPGATFSVVSFRFCVARAHAVWHRSASDLIIVIIKNK